MNFNTVESIGPCILLPCTLKLFVDSVDYENMFNFACDQTHAHDAAASSTPQGNVTRFLGR